MPFKGNAYLVQAFKSIFERVPNARGYIVGEGELGEALQARSEGARHSRPPDVLRLQA